MTSSGEINGFLISYLRKHSEHNIRIGRSETPGKWGCSIDQFKAGGIDFTIDYVAKSVTYLDNFLAALMAEGRIVFKPGHPHEGWHYSGVAGDLSSDLRLSNNVPDRGYPVSFLFCADLPFMASDVLHSRGKYISTNGQTWSTDDSFPGNLVKNFSFENWTNGTTAACPDNWSLGDGSSGGNRSAISKIGTYSYLITGNGTDATIGEILQSIPFEAGKTYKFGIWAKVASRTTGKAEVSLYVDGSKTDFVDVSANTDWTWLTFSHTFTSVPADAHVDIAGLDTPNNGALFYFDGFVVTESTNYENNTFGSQITTAGTVAAIPDIEVIAAYLGASGQAPGGSYTVSDGGTNTWSTTQTSYILNHTITIAAVAGVSHRIDVARFKQWSSSTSYTQWAKVTLTTPGWNGGAEGTIVEYSNSVLQANMVSRDSVTYGTAAITCTVNTQAVLKIYVKTGGSGTSYAKYFSVDYTEMGSVPLPTSLSVYKTSDTLTKLQVCNTLIPNSRIRINADDTGEYAYLDDYSDNSYSFIATVSGTVTYSATNKNIAIANTAYLIYPHDVKYPVTGIPTLSLYVNSGRPLVYIALDNGAGSPSTFYECDNNPTGSLTDQVYTYSLNNAANLQLKNSTKFYVKIIPYTGTSCTLSAYQIYIKMITVDAERPLIDLGSSNTFKIDMSADTPCFVSLYWNDRKWGV